MSENLTGSWRIRKLQMVVALAVFFAACQKLPARSHSVTLNWTASTSTVAGYNVYRTSLRDNKRQKLTSQLVAGTKYVDSRVQAGRTYTYAVTSVDAGGNESVPTPPVTAIVPKH